MRAHFWCICVALTVPTAARLLTEVSDQSVRITVPYGPAAARIWRMSAPKMAETSSSVVSDNRLARARDRSEMAVRAVPYCYTARSCRPYRPASAINPPSSVNDITPILAGEASSLRRLRRADQSVKALSIS